MSDQNHKSVVFVGRCVQFLEAHAERVRKAIVALKTLQHTAEQFDHENVEVMAQAIIDSSLSPNVMRPATRQGVWSGSPPLRDVDPPFDPSAPTHEATHFQRIAAFFVKAANQAFSTASLSVGVGLSRGAVTTVLYTTHRDKFEKSPAKGATRWRMTPNAFQDALNARKTSEKAIVSHTALGD